LSLARCHQGQSFPRLWRLPSRSSC
jgi:hypothetical protein